MAPLCKPGRGDAPRHENPRRAAGALESAVLNVLWEAGAPLSPAEVREQLIVEDGDGAGGPAYSTVVTILTRLYEKDTLTRERDGRAFRYAPVADEHGLAARRLTAVLEAASDRIAVLSGFVENLTDHDERLLRALLEGRARPANAESE